MIALVRARNGPLFHPALHYTRTPQLMMIIQQYTVTTTKVQLFNTINAVL